ncbi:MAG TPA: sigma-70 family RNA polymerase sigma factor [Eubacteriaceae bacterium]|nr:sigma-70 family RNA polymerase sigma factor [Eubacteriaceae bacterium]
MEQKLIKEIKKGDHKAFTTLYNKYAEYALRVAIAVTKNNANGADAVQETFIRVYRNISKFDTSKNFKPWFYKILINECRRIMYFSTDAVTIDEKIINNKQFSKEDFYPFQEYEGLYKAIQNLDEINRVPIILKYLQDFSEKEVSEILDLNINTVKSRLYKGRQKLKNILNNGEGISND